MKMKRRAIALLLALMMCLSLLSACGADKTEEAAAPESAVDTAGQQEVVKEEPKQEPEQEAPEEPEEPEEEESEEEEPEEAAEPEQEEVEEQNNAGTEFLALLQEEYENGFFMGEGPRHSYYEGYAPFIYDGVVYISRTEYNGGVIFGACDIASKEINVLLDGGLRDPYIFLDGNFFAWGNRGYSLFDRYSLERVKMIDNDSEDFDGCILFDKGFLFSLKNGSSVLFSNNHEKIAEISAPQREIEHGLIEDMELNKSDWFAADGTVYTKCKGDDSLYRLNTDTYEWENTGNAPASIGGSIFYGKYFSSSDGIYDRITGELVFEYGELYKAACHFNDNQCYFGGDKYLGYNGGEYRWVSLTDLSMSDPLPFPEGKVVTILNDTYCVYEDKYGWFLWNYNDGTEETIMLYEN